MTCGPCSCAIAQLRCPSRCTPGEQGRGRSHRGVSSRGRAAPTLVARDTRALDRPQSLRRRQGRCRAHSHVAARGRATRELPRTVRIVGASAVCSLAAIQSRRSTRLSHHFDAAGAEDRPCPPSSLCPVTARGRHWGCATLCRQPAVLRVLSAVQESELWRWPQQGLPNRAANCPRRWRRCRAPRRETRMGGRGAATFRPRV